VATIALAALAGGSVALSAGVMIGSTVGCVLLAGPILHLLAGSRTHFSSGSLLISLTWVVAVPLVVAGAVRSRFDHDGQQRADEAGAALASAAVLVLVWLVASQAHPSPAYLRAAGALLVFIAASGALAVALTVGLRGPERISLALPIGMRDFAVAAGVASRAFGPSSAAVLGLYGVLVLLAGAGTARLLGRR
jgi:BASS family bile acid:Na+ symporter